MNNDHDYATVTKALSVDIELLNQPGEKSISISTTSSGSELNGMLNEYTGLGERDSPKSSVYTALVRPHTSESK